VFNHSQVVVKIVSLSVVTNEWIKKIMKCFVYNIARVEIEFYLEVTLL
jgi:hypothetical protein